MQTIQLPSLKKSHVQILKKLCERLRRYKLRFNSVKCLFGVKFVKLLGFMVSNIGIKVDLNKVKAIQSISSLKIEKEVKGFLGRLNYIFHFIFQLTTTCELIF